MHQFVYGITSNVHHSYGLVFPPVWLMDSSNDNSAGSLSSTPCFLYFYRFNLKLIWLFFISQLSEGLDFADRAGRAVIVTGIPFAMRTDPKVSFTVGIENVSHEYIKHLFNFLSLNILPT